MHSAQLIVHANWWERSNSTTNFCKARDMSSSLNSKWAFFFSYTLPSLSHNEHPLITKIALKYPCHRASEETSKQRRYPNENTVCEEHCICQPHSGSTIKGWRHSPGELCGASSILIASSTSSPNLLMTGSKVHQRNGPNGTSIRIDSLTLVTEYFIFL